MKVNRCPNEKILDEYFTHFKRFLKENGYYSLVINYLFPPKRTKEDFFDGVKKLYNLNSSRRYNFGDILHIVYTLGPSYKKSFAYWDKIISPISDKWVEEFEKLNI